MSDTLKRINAALEGRYVLESEIGQGGMATVYLADDLKHERKVALKVLKPELAAVVGGDRFLSEIKTTANLQHPHILPLFDSGEADSFLFFVMPYIEGETLGARLDREKQLPVDEALGIATAVANALHTAHEAGVVHRDIKPANILLSRGEPLVADFGIALAVGAAGGSRLTETGLSVGTPYYMSPEQATGDQAIGAASDTYSLACVLYEMLIGEPPYPGSTAQAVLGKIIQGIPVSATSIRKSIPLNVDAAIRKALEKLPADRFSNAQDFAKALSDPAFRHGASPAGTAAGAGRVWNPLSAALAASTVLLLGALGWSMTRAPAAPETVRHVIEPIWNGQPRAIGTYTALAPDGSGMVYARAESGATAWMLWYKSPGSLEPTQLAGTENGRNVVYSPDSRRIAFVSGTTLKSRPVADGGTVTLAGDLSPPPAMIGLAWQDDGTILHEAPDLHVVRIPEGGGAADTIMHFEGFQQLSSIGALPGSQAALVTVCVTACPNGSELHVVDLEERTHTLLLEDVIRGWYLPTGHLMYVQGDGAVFAAPFDAASATLTGTGVSLFEDVGITVSSPELAIGHDGTLVYARGTIISNERIVVWVDRDGQVTEIDPENLGPAPYISVALSPNDDRLILAILDSDLAEWRLWVKQLPDGPMTRLTPGDEVGARPDWSSDGRSLAYVYGVNEAWTVRADASAPRETLSTSERTIHEIQHLADGRFLVRLGGAAGADIAIYDPATEAFELILGEAYAEWNARVSPDGRWIAYASDQSGDSHVYVRPFPALDALTQVSTVPSDNPVWAHNGRELFFRRTDGVNTIASYETTDGFDVTDRTTMVDFTSGGFWRVDDNWKAFDVSADDQRIVTLRRAGVTEAGDATEVILVHNFFTDLKRRLGN
jgi:eukaryotic-like serine/threonine-protein kinase